METMTTQSPAAKLKWTLLVALALVMAWVAWSAYTQSKENLAQPDRLIILNETAMWLPVAAKLLVLALLALGWWRLSMAPWGGDRTWTSGTWRDTEANAARAGERALLAEPIKEPKGNQKLWAVLGVVIALPFALWTLRVIGAHPLEAGVQLVVLLGILGLSLRSVVKVYTRRVQFDDAGLSDADFFGVRRVPWVAVKSMKSVNLNAKAQRLYDRTRLTERLGSRPEDDMGAWDVCGEQGVVLLRLYRSMVPQDALSALRERIQQQIRDGGKDAFGFAKQGSAPSAPVAADALVEEARADGEGGRVLDPNDPRDRKLLQEHEAIRRMDQVSARKRGKSDERVMKGCMALMFLLPLAGTCYLGYESLWFRFAAAEAQGRVVQADGNPPALLVEYLGAAERMLLTKSDPSEDYTGVAVGASVRVFYDPVDPDRVRLDLFDEMWFSMLLVGGLTLFAGLMAAAAWGIMRQAKP